ncbi:PIR Superfamily Protein [Plasmodium ovale curtisi]|uniref:PIR Superfamily Protein n=1 Tax=Plasmodium ovale curtisi TaxID=864141 RepID=A0A1A8X5U0_PLAOA|nr:PIR Superfamily Protein [Plasmodium ovale curtisi]
MVEESYEFCNDFDKYISTETMLEVGYSELKYKLKKYNNAAVYANNFYNRIKSNYDWSNEANKLKDKIYNISEVHLRNMTTLYDLYRYYHKIITIIDSPNENECWNYSETCVQKYEEANQNCYRNTSKFCDALKSFNEKYQTIGEQPSLKCKIKTISLLPAYGEQSSEADISLEKSKQIMEVTQSQQISYSAGSVKTICVVIVTLFSIFFISLIFYKYTPVGPWCRGKIKSKKKIWKNSQENDQLLLHDSGYNDTNNEDRIYDLSYSL